MSSGKIYGKWCKRKQEKKNIDRLLSWHGKLSAQEMIYAAGTWKMWKRIQPLSMKLILQLLRSTCRPSLHRQCYQLLTRLSTERQDDADENTCLHSVVWKTCGNFRSRVQCQDMDKKRKAECSHLAKIYILIFGTTVIVLTPPSYRTSYSFNNWSKFYWIH